MDKPFVHCTGEQGGMSKFIGLVTSRAPCYLKYIPSALDTSVVFPNLSRRGCINPWGLLILLLTVRQNLQDVPPPPQHLNHKFQRGPHPGPPCKTRMLSWGVLQHLFTGAGFFCLAGSFEMGALSLYMRHLVKSTPYLLASGYLHWLSDSFK